MNDRIPRTQRDRVLLDVKAKPSGGLRPALTPTAGAVPKQRAAARCAESSKIRSLRFQGIAGFDAGSEWFRFRAASPAAGAGDVTRRHPLQ